MNLKAIGSGTTHGVGIGKKRMSATRRSLLESELAAHIVRPLWLNRPGLRTRMYT